MHNQGIKDWKTKVIGTNGGSYFREPRTNSEGNSRKGRERIREMRHYYVAGREKREQKCLIFKLKMKK